MIFMGRANMYRRQEAFTHRMQFAENQKSKDETKEGFPHCRDTFDTCPTEHDFKAALEHKMALAVCGKCPVFQKSNIKGINVQRQKLMSSEDEEFYRKIMEK